MANYPTSVPSFSNKSAGQTIASAHMNAVQDEVVAIGSGLLQGTAPLASSNSTVQGLSVLGNSTFSGSVRYSGVQSISLSSGNTSNVTLDSTTYIFTLSPAAGGSTVQGITAATQGRTIFILNGGGVNLVLEGESASAAATTRFLAASTIAAGYGTYALYTGSRWVIARNG